MKRRVQFGCGHNRLPEPWENYDKNCDIRKQLPFSDNSVQFILAEHVIEHVTFESGLFFLKECLRILEPQGVIRLSFPDITREIPTREYGNLVLKHYRRSIHKQFEVWHSILTDWDHKSCWTAFMAQRVFIALGFSAAAPVLYGASSIPELNRIDNHHRSVGLTLAIAETTIIEAKK